MSLTPVSDYAKKLRDPRWQLLRLKVFERDNGACTYCGDTKTELQVHHLKYCGDPWMSKMKDLRTACKHCHYVISDLHRQKKQTVSHIKKSSQNIAAITDKDIVHIYCYYKDDSYEWIGGISKSGIDWAHNILNRKNPAKSNAKNRQLH